MIPKVIHYVWLSGDEKPQLIRDCIQSWRYKLPDYQIREWTMADVESIDSKFLHDAIAARKWAFATDFLRYYIIYHNGGIYMDSDIYVFRDFEPFLDAGGFTSFEMSGIMSSEGNKKGIDYGLEAAVFGAEKGSKWIKHILDYYMTIQFKNDPNFFLSIIAPKIMWERSKDFGLRTIMSFQRIDGDVRIYPGDTLSCIADYSLYGLSRNDYNKLSEVNPLKFAVHLCNNSWGWKPKKTNKQKIKEFIINIVGADKPVAAKRWVKQILHC